MGVPCHVLRGSQDKTVKEWLTKMPIFGKGKHKSKNYWQALGRCLVPESLVAQKLQGGNNFGRGGGRGGFNRGFTTFSISEKGQVFLDNPAAELMIVPTKELRQERFVAAAKPKLSLTPVAFNASATSGGGENSVSRVMRNALSALRIDVAADMNIPPYMVISEEQLQKMAVRTTYCALGVESTN
jgi:superfamily II DNA helicase RecQ